MKGPGAKSFRLGKILSRIVAVVAALFLLLLIPERERPAPAGAGRTPFAWNQDALWTNLERQFLEARTSGCPAMADRVSSRFAETESLVAEMGRTTLAPDAAQFDRLETNLFELAPLVGACPDRLNDYVALAGRARVAVKRQSQGWDFAAPQVRTRLYRLLFGMRMALEEVMLQTPSGMTFAELTRIEDEPSQTPAFEVQGLKLHSGDILVSRGGAPTSALIARGNDYPGSFSHVALLHVDEISGQAVVIESHIERGVAVRSFDEYLKDKKLRIMVLRLRADLPAMKADPLLPHKAAESAMKETGRRHIPYDFAMDCEDPEKQFCSEVVSVAYAGQGAKLWAGPTFISSPVVTAWLASLGVRHFETQEPADLEYDPQLRVVAEWRGRSTLLKAHVDDAVTDVLLKGGQPGEGLPYQHWLLPVARLSKAYSAVLNRFGKVGPIPEGMSATEALRVKKFRRDHETLANCVLELAGRVKAEKGYTPLYWELVDLARQARQEPTRD